MSDPINNQSALTQTRDSSPPKSRLSNHNPIVRPSHQRQENIPQQVSPEEYNHYQQMQFNDYINQFKKNSDTEIQNLNKIKAIIDENVSSMKNVASDLASKRQQAKQNADANFAQQQAAQQQAAQQQAAQQQMQQPYGGIPPYGASPYGGVSPYGASPYGGIPPYGASPYGGVSPYGASPYGGVSPYGASPYGGIPPYGASPYGGVSPYGASPYGGVSPYGASPYGGVSPYGASPYYQQPQQYYQPPYPSSVNNPVKNDD